MATNACDDDRLGGIVAMAERVVETTSSDRFCYDSLSLCVWSLSPFGKRLGFIFKPQQLLDAIQLRPYQK